MLAFNIFWFIMNQLCLFIYSLQFAVMGLKLLVMPHHKFVLELK